MINSICIAWSPLGQQQEVQRDIKCFHIQLKVAENVKHPLLCSTQLGAESRTMKDSIFSYRPGITYRARFITEEKQLVPMYLKSRPIAFEFIAKDSVPFIYYTDPLFPKVIKVNDPFQCSRVLSDIRVHFWTLQTTVV